METYHDIKFCQFYHFIHTRDIHTMICYELLTLIYKLLNPACSRGWFSSSVFSNLFVSTFMCSITDV